MDEEKLNEDKPIRMRGLRRVMAATVGFVGIFLIAAHFFQFDQLAAVTLVPPWLMLIPAIVLTALSVAGVSRKQLLILLGIIAIFIVMFVEEARSLTRFRKLTQERPRVNEFIRVATINCNVGSVEAGIEPSAYSPDIVLLQESPGPLAIEQLAFQYFDKDGAGLHTLDASIIVNGSIKPVQVDRGSHFVHGVVTLKSGKRVDVISLRLSAPVFRIDILSRGFWEDHVKTRKRHREQLEQVKAHLTKFAETDVWIVGGDFNLVGNDGALSAFDGMHDTFFEGGAGWGNTGTNDYPLFRVDQIWCSSKLKCRVSNSIKTEFSDHRMVVADLELSP